MTEPLDYQNHPQPESSANPALQLIRNKIDKVYLLEPDASSEQSEVKHLSHRSKHQQFMYELTTSGKDMAQIQTEWHNYYRKLSDQEKHQVWQEFYASSRYAGSSKILQPLSLDSHDQNQQFSDHVQQRGTNSSQRPKRKTDTLRQTIRSRAASQPKLTLKHHVQSALFGLGMGMVVVFILLFGFFNEVFIAPFIQPSRSNTATPIIISSSTIAPSSTPEVIIPKINVEIPVDYSVTTTNESVIENDLNSGVVHFPTTSVPGQNGNAAFFGHSSNNIFNPGKYKFAFVLLHELVPGDIFYLTYNGKVYAYKVFSSTIVSPSDVSVLNPVAGHPATATLITCDPPGTSLNRLIVVGDQISPNPNTDSAATIAQPPTTTQLPSNGPSLWNRFISTLYGKLLSLAFILIVIWRIGHWYKKEFRHPTVN